MKSRAGGDPGQQALPRCQHPGCPVRLPGLYRMTASYRSVSRISGQTRPRSPAGREARLRPPRGRGRVRRLHRNKVDIRIFLPEETARSRDGPAGPHAGHKHIPLAACILPDLRPGRLIVGPGVGPVHGTARAQPPLLSLPPAHPPSGWRRPCPQPRLSGRSLPRSPAGACAAPCSWSPAW